MHVHNIFPLILAVALLAAPLRAADVIPLPAEVHATGRSVAIPAGPIGYAHASLAPEAEYLRAALADRGMERKVKASRKLRKGFLLRIDASLPGAEAYRLETSDKGVTLTGGSRAGVFYAIQTLLQQMEDGHLPAGTLTDAPRYGWRGIMLDESRHFFGREKVEQLLDLMATYKLNKFHWHLTDEPAWRIEIKQYPLLTEEGGRGTWSHPQTRQLQYYSQDDIRAIVAYAAARHIEVIPEIDMPGHATAANRAYPFLSGGGTKDHPHFTFNVGRDTVYSFLTNVLREVAALFPSPYLHLGGDEVAFGIEAWKTDPHVQALMKREGMTDVRQAERYFMLRMADSVKALGKTLIGWDELLDLQPDTASTVIQWWRHDRPQNLKRALSAGYRTILCPRRPLYFDFIQHKSHRWGRVWNGFCPLEDVYAFPDGGPVSGFDRWQIADGERDNVIGLQANVWTERIHTPERLDFMLFPRLCAVAEAGWTQPAAKDYADFSRRMEQAYKHFDALGIYYFDPRQPARHSEPKGAERSENEQPMDFRD